MLYPGINCLMRDLLDKPKKDGTGKSFIYSTGSCKSKWVGGNQAMQPSFLLKFVWKISTEVSGEKPAGGLDRVNSPSTQDKSNRASLHTVYNQ